MLPKLKCPPFSTSAGTWTKHYLIMEPYTPNPHSSDSDANHDPTDTGFDAGGYSLSCSIDAHRKGQADDDLGKAIKPEKLAAFLEGLRRARVVARVIVDDVHIDEVLSLRIEQSLQGHHKLQMRFYQDQVQATGTLLIDGAEKLLGKVAEVELYDLNEVSEDRLQNLFIIADVQFEHQALNEGILQLTGYAPTWILDGTAHFETFYKKSLDAIVEAVTKPLSQVKAGTQIKSTLGNNLTYLCRFNESSWNFLKRLSAETGQWLYFNGTTLIFGEPEAKQGSKVVYGDNCSKLNMSLRARPVQEQLFDYDAEGNQRLQVETLHYTGNAGAYNEMAYKKSKDLFGTIRSAVGPVFLPPGSEILETLSDHKSQQQASDMYYVQGESTEHSLRVGLNVDVELSRLGEQAKHAPIRITRIEHHWDVTGKYHNYFEGIPAAAEMPPSTAYQKPMTHPVLAEVIDHADNQGRVRVQFMGWQQEEGRPETDFIRVLTPDAGHSEHISQNRGLVFIPEIGDQVYVDFEAGNPDRPFVVGSVFHGQNGSGGKAGNNTKSIITKSGHTLEFDDTDGGTHLVIRDPAGNEIRMDTQGKNISLRTPETMTLDCKNMHIRVAENMTTAVGQDHTGTIGRNSSLTVGADSGYSVGGRSDMLIGGDQLLMVTGNLAEVIEGDLSSEVKKERTEHSTGDMEFQSNGSITNNAEKEIQNNSGENTKIN